MNREELKGYLETTFPQYTVEDTFDFPLLWVPAAELLQVLTALKQGDKTKFNFLFCETAVDRNTHFEVVYHIHSYDFKHDMVVKVKLDEHTKMLRFELGQRVRHQLRIVPELAFYIDDSLDYVERIDNLLK